MSENNNIKIEDLLPRYCDGSLTEQEKEIVEAWLKECPEHRQILRNMLRLCIDMDALDIMNGVDTEKALSQVKRTIYKNRFKKVLSGFQRVAAVLLIPLVAAVTWLAISEKQQNKKSVATVSMMEFSTNPGMTGSVTLPDGTTVFMNSNSTLRYPSYFEENGSRSVEFEGEAFFDVVKNSSSPFEVTVSSGEKIRVYGTKFNLEAYSGKNVVTSLVSGSVGFIYRDPNAEEKEVRLKPQHKLEYNATTGLLSLQESSCEAETAWKEGKLLLDRTPLSEILHILSKRYDVDFLVSNHSLLELSFSGGYITMNRLEQLLNTFSISSSMNWRVLPATEPNQKQVIEIY